MPKYRGYSFGLQPASKLAKTIMSQPNTHSTTFEFGRVIPIKCEHVVAGDIISEKIAGLIRMSTPIAPIMSGIKGSLHAFFVPMRLLWDHTKEFFGENTSSAGPQNTPYYIPHGVINGTSDDSSVKVGSVAHYLGYPLRKVATSGARNDRTLNILPIRGYWEIINNYYRAEQVMDPWIIDKGDTGAIGTRGLINLKVSDVCAKSLKNFDIFTTSLIQPTYGGETSLPLLGYAPLKNIDAYYVSGTGPIRFGNDVIFKDAQNNPIYYPMDMGESGRIGIHDGAGSDIPGTPVDKGALTLLGVGNFKTSLVADLSKATATKLNDLYLAMAVEKWKYHANFGSRYFERLEVSYGVRNPDLVLDRPEHLGEYHFDINVQTVISTAGTSDANLGQPGANSATGIKCNLFNHSFGEPGYLYILLNTYVDQIYSAGADRFLTDKDILDLYWPEFVNKGDEKVLVDNIYFDESQNNVGQAFGYQEAWAFERFQKSRASGLLDPYVDSSINSSQAGLKGFIVAQKFSTAPSLDEDFLLEDRTPLTEALVSGNNGPDFVADFLFDEKITRSITPRSEPGIPSRLW